MRITEITNKLPTPQQSRINALKQQKERASTQLKTEREQQKRLNATQAIQKNTQVLAKLNNH
ncbi:hypothetical protein MCEMSEM29_00539 [Methylophilaceae bacterium]